MSKGHSFWVKPSPVLSPQSRPEPLSWQIAQNAPSPPHLSVFTNTHATCHLSALLWLCPQPRLPFYIDLTCLCMQLCLALKTSSDVFSSRKLPLNTSVHN